MAVLIKTGHFQRHMKRDGVLERQRERMAVYVPRREAVEGTNPAATLTLDFWPLV